MAEAIQTGYMAFIAEGHEGIGAVRAVEPDHIVLYVENSGEFVVPRSAVKKVHDQKVILVPEKLNRDLLKAIGHSHDREDPSVAG